jgi:K+-transporting ATPase ATPase A chain
MSQGWLQIAVFLAILTALVPLIGGYMAKVFQGERVFLSPVVGPIERLGYRLFRVRPDDGQDWKGRRVSSSAFSWLALY